ncbi:MAG: toll/interleukin-1 receptor domain-containing protein [Blastocatellia bacterium]|nr:toll/interleukin-1 receptor domain-containing protein [Blastocatellia bacterium]
MFICYRRDDAEGYAGRIYDRLHARFPGRVFMDVTGINPGADFSRVIQDTVGSCHVLLAIIGKQWLTIADSTTKPRIQRDDDYVRHEIATALYRNIAVIPVLVRDATMPGSDALPPDLAGLSTRNALEISDDDFEHDAQRLISAIEYVMGETRVAQPPPPPTKSSNRTCLILAVVGILVVRRRLSFDSDFSAIATSNRTGGGGGDDGPYPVPTATATQQPQPGYEPAPATGQFPVGNWNITLVLPADGHEEHYTLDISSDGTYQSNGMTRRWGPLPDGSTIRFEGWGDITFQNRAANGYTGYGYLNGNTYNVMLTPRNVAE